MDRDNLEKHREQMNQLLAGEIDSAEVNTSYVHAQGLLVPVVGTIRLVKSGDEPDQKAYDGDPQQGNDQPKSTTSAWAPTPIASEDEERIRQRVHHGSPSRWSSLRCRVAPPPGRPACRVGRCGTWATFAVRDRLTRDPTFVSVFLRERSGRPGRQVLDPRRPHHGGHHPPARSC
jgi:hypothetical protein